MRVIWLILSLFCMIPASLEAKSIAGMFMNMPDSLIPYLSADIRSSLLQQPTQSNGKIQSLLHEDISVDSLSEDYLKIRLSASSILEAMQVKTDNGDELCCIVRTYYGPAAESTVELYDSAWHKLSSEPLPKVKVSDLIARPDTMSNSNYKQALKELSPLLISIEAQPQNHGLVYSLSLPLGNKEGRKKLEAILKPRKYIWNGSTFR